MFTASRLSPSPFAVSLVLLAAAAGPLRADDFDVRGLQHEVLCREALAADPVLRPLNLVVRVKDRVATLSGPVPTRELAQRAVQALQKLPELREVRSRLMVQFADDGLLLPWPVPTKGMPVLPPPPPAEPKKTSVEGVWKPVNPPTESFKPKAPPSDVETVSRPKDRPADPPDAAAISGAVQDLVLGEDRYRRLRYELKLGKVYLSGVVYRWADVQELARALNRIPGVDGVVLREVRVEAKK